MYFSSNNLVQPVTHLVYVDHCKSDNILIFGANDMQYRPCFLLVISDLDLCISMSQNTLEICVWAMSAGCVFIV